MTIIPPDLNQSALRQELARRRAQRGMSYDDLAEHTGLSRRALIEIEQGRIIGTLTTWHKIAHALGVPLGDLVSVVCEGHEPPSPPQG